MKHGMNIGEVVKSLESADASFHIRCRIFAIGLESNISAIGQLKPSVPGAVLGNREPYLREKQVSDFRSELASFGENFLLRGFLARQIVEVSENKYELRYFPINTVSIENQLVFLVSTESEIIEFREAHCESN